jgi:galactokinase
MKPSLFEKADRALSGLAGSADCDRRRWFVPGRIEVLGKHTDYAGGRSLVCAVERGFAVVSAPRGDGLVHIRDAGRGLEFEIPISGEPAPGGRIGWTVYAETVVRRIARNFPAARTGCDIALVSDLPRASGLSSSSALVAALFTAIADANRLEDLPEYRGNIRAPEDLAGYLGCVENGYAFGTLAGEEGVGTFGGSEDHTAILCGREGHLSVYSYCPVRAEGSVPLPAEWTFVVAVSGVASDKTGSARERYNRASLSTRAIVELWNRATGRSDPTLASAVARAEDAPDRIRDVLRYVRHPDFPSDRLLDRFDHFFEESERLVPAAAEAFAREDAESLSRIVDRSQERAESLLGNQIPETVNLARSARHLGAIAASAFGGGFGGSVWALVPIARADFFRADWRSDYLRRFPAAGEKSEFFVTGAGQGRAIVPGPAL